MSGAQDQVPRKRPAGPPAWVDVYFASAYRRLYRRLVDNEGDQRRAVEWIARQLAWSDSDWVLDLACGYGRHLRHLRRLAARAVGLDLAESQLRQAQSDLAPETPALVQGDMARLPFADGVLGAVLLLFNSLGYRSRAEDLGSHGEVALLHEIARVLRPRGRAVLEIPSIDHVRAAVAEEPSMRLEDGDLSIEERWTLGAGGRMLLGETTFVEGERVETVHFHVRLFTLAEMNAMALEAGLRPTSAFGDLEGAPFMGRECNQLVLVLERRL